MFSSTTTHNGDDGPRHRSSPQHRSNSNGNSNNNYTFHNNHHQYLDNQQSSYSQHGLLIGIVTCFLLGFTFSYGNYSMDTYDMLQRTFSLFYIMIGGRGRVKNRDEVEPSSTVMEWLGDVTLAKTKLHNELKSDYSEEYYGVIFDKATIEQHVFPSNPISKQRLRRRFQLKMLSAQQKKINLKHKHHHSSSSFFSTMIQPKKKNNNNNNKSKVGTTGGSSSTTTFTWVTAGDSVAAGHGNLYLQSYTKVMEQSLKGIFRLMDINFVVRNYAMGQYVSGPELAMCMESIYGTDIDALMWDFSLMEQSSQHIMMESQSQSNESNDGGSHVEDHSRALLWGYRASIHPTKPILFAMESSSSHNSRWKSVWNRLEHNNGMGVIMMDDGNGLNVLKHRIPDTIHGEGGKSRIPSTIKNYRCNYQSFEAMINCNDPVRYNTCDDIDHAKPCLDAKWKTKDMCMDAKKHQLSWHPGWKEHYLKGRLLSVYLLDTIMDALIELHDMIVSQQQTLQSWQDIYDYLLQQEANDFLMAKMASPPMVGQPSVFSSFQETIARITPDVLYKKHAICQTALLPAQERYDGILMETGHKTVVENNDYDRGLNRYFLMNEKQQSLTKTQKDIPLVFDPNDRQRCDYLEIDHKDFFWIRHGDGWLSRTIPNHMELATYKHSSIDDTFMLGHQSTTTEDGIASTATTNELIMDIYSVLEDKLAEQNSNHHHHNMIESSSETAVVKPTVEGIIMICLKICPLKRCPDDTIGFGPLKRGTSQLVIMVDGVKVSSVEKLGDCHVLQTPNGGLRWGPGKHGNGQYKLSVLINDKQKNNMKISSFIVL